MENRWRCCPTCCTTSYLIYRAVMALYTTCYFVQDAVSENSLRFMAYLTNWSYLMLVTYFLSSAVIAIYYHHCKGQGRHRHPKESVTLLAQANFQSRPENDISIMALVVTDENKKRTEKVTGQPQDVDLKSIHVPTSSSTNKSFQYLDQEDEDITWPMKANWILGNIVQVFAIVVTVIYFNFLFNGELTCRDINVHLLNTVFILLETCITARPVRLLHVIHPIIYGGCYIIFNAIYWSFDHEKNVLYPGVLDWNHPETTLKWVAGLSLVVVPVLQLIYFGLYRLRIHIRRIFR